MQKNGINKFRTIVFEVSFFMGNPGIEHTLYIYIFLHALSQKLKTGYTILYDIPKFPFWGLNICVDFDLSYSKKIKIINKLNEIIFHNKNIDLHKTA